MASLEIEKTPVESKESGEIMIFNISLTNWGRIVGKLMILYVGLGLYFTMLLYLGFKVRKQDYLRLPSAYFGDFERNFAYPSVYTSHHVDPKVYKANRPTGCSTVELTLNSGPTLLTQCDSGKNGMWNVFPWVNETEGLGSMPAPCFSGDEDGDYSYLATQNMLELYCSNFIKIPQQQQG